MRAGALAFRAALLVTSGCEQILSLHDRSEAVDASTPNTADETPGAQAEAGPADGSSSSATTPDAADAGGPTAGHCGSLLHPSAACASCMDQSCCAQAQACANDPACREASACLAMCADDACRAQCALFYTLPDALIALRSCRVSDCAAACGSSCGEFASAIPGCQACEEATCCSTSAGCAADAACSGLNLCVSNCFGAASCPNECQSRYAGGVTAYTASLSCSNQCAAQCAPGQTWSCLDAPIAWPKPNAVGNVAFSVTFVSFTTEEPFVGAKVKACSKLDFACTSPIDTAVTDATGRVTVHVPTGLSGFDGYLDVTGGSVGDGGPGAFPTIWYPIPYVIADGWRGRTLLLSTDEFMGLTMATATTLDPTRGHVAMNAADCAFTPASGVRFSADSSDQATVRYYLVGGVPVTTATETDSSGIAAFVNLPTMSPARLTVVSATAGAANSKSMGSFTFIVRAGTLTTSGLFPPLP
jgi:hypothetical protein